MQWTVETDEKLIVFYGTHKLTAMPAIAKKLKSVAGSRWKEWSVHFGEEAISVNKEEKPAEVETTPIPQIKGFRR